MFRNPFKVRKMIAFFRAKDPQKRYTYLDGLGCPLALYLQSCGYKKASCGVTWFSYDSWRGRIQKSIPEWANSTVFDCYMDGRTYGALVARLERLDV